MGITQTWAKPERRAGENEGNLKRPTTTELVLHALFSVREWMKVRRRQCVPSSR